MLTCWQSRQWASMPQPFACVLPMVTGETGMGDDRKAPAWAGLIDFLRLWLGELVWKKLYSLLFDRLNRRQPTPRRA